jgi:hypothetical protein
MPVVLRARDKNRIWSDEYVQFIPQPGCSTCPRTGGGGGAGGDGVWRWEASPALCPQQLVAVAASHTEPPRGLAG